MANLRTEAADRVKVVREAFAAALRGEIEGVSELLAEDVRWHAAGDEGGGCQNREQALVWLGEAISRGVHAELLDVRALDQDRVLVLLQRNLRRDGDPAGTQPSPHGQIVTFRGGKVAEIVIYPSDEEALSAVGGPDASL
jgi:ketosteroid isomerase-like protein